MFDADTQFSAHTDSEPRAAAPSTKLYRRHGKRMFDLLFAVAVSPIIMPVIAILAILVRLDGGPAFFGHWRVGRNGKAFQCWKLRTMVPDAEKRLKEHLQQNEQDNSYWQANFKLPNDPRVTKLGKILRKTSLDELPQFWNALIGDMSVVGPRPVTALETGIYGSSASLVQSLRPGVTGLWQVSGRNDVGYDERVAIDVSYASNLTFFGDIKIILMTIVTVLRRTGK